VTCSALKGTDGICEGTKGGNICTARVCNNATLVTDFDCNSYKKGCITTGKGCVAPPLPSCASFIGDDMACKGYIGSDGICEGEKEAKHFRSRICSSAPTTTNTD